MSTASVDKPQAKPPLNGICPYYTMFPISFPRRVLARANKGDVVADPFCGRGTTLYAARELGLEAHGTDISPVAVAISRAKLSSSSPELVLKAYDRLISNSALHEVDVPRGRFWSDAYHPETLITLCKLRQALIQRDRASESGAQSLLRALILGALHGPLNNGPTPSSYFSNQMMRSFAPKPDYAIRFWKKHRMKAPYSDVRSVIQRRVNRIFQQVPRSVPASSVRVQDAREFNIKRLGSRSLDWVVTSPPYYGMRTYEVDQWLRTWFTGGKDYPAYQAATQLSHQSPEIFASELANVWSNVDRQCNNSTKIVIRFGAIRSRHADYDEILKTSLSMSKTGWKHRTTKSAGTANNGRRQATSMGPTAKSASVEERDYFIDRR